MSKIIFNEHQIRQLGSNPNVASVSVRYFKDEVDFHEAQSLSELKEMIDDYMYYYNSTSKQWNLKKRLRSNTEVSDCNISCKVCFY